jgi:carbonic anhydrase
VQLIIIICLEKQVITIPQYNTSIILVAGPHVWGDHWSIAKNPKYGQSPINIEPDKAIVKTDWPTPQFKFRPDRCRVFKNNGHTVQVDVDGPDIGNKDDWCKYKGNVY